jgi:hypothetical protein
MKRILNTLIATFLLASGASEAAVISYTSQAAWLAAAGTATTSQNFNGLSGANVLSGVDLGGGMSVKASATGWNITGAQSAGNTCSIDTTASLCGNSISVLTFTFANAISSFGASFSSMNDDIQRTQFELFNGATLIATLTPPIVSGQVDQFYGFVAGAGQSITSLRTKYVAGDAFGIDNVAIVSAAKVPEPGNLALMGLGLLGLVFARRRTAKH